MSSLEAPLGRERITRVIAFAGLATLAGARYASTEARPPTARVIALVALAVAAAAGLSLSGAGSGRRGGLPVCAARAVAVLLLLLVALLCAGVPARLLLPDAWPTLGSHLRTGLDAVAVTLWPYSGHNVWARIDILLGLAVIGLGAAAVGCWPASQDSPGAALRLRIRRLGALALLITLFVIGVVNSSGGPAVAQGLVLLVVVVGWLWLPGLGARRTLTAAGWLAVAGAVAASLSIAVAGGQSWFNYRAWDLLGAGQSSFAFTWDQTYGPIPWSRSRATMFTVRGATPALWKVTTLDRFDGLRFVRSGTDPPTEQDLPLPLNDRWYEFATFTIAGLKTRLLPTEPGTTAGVTYRGQLEYEADGTVRSVSHPLHRGDTYTVMSYVPEPTPAELSAAPRSFPPGYLRYTAFDLPTPTQSGLRLAATDPVHPGQFLTARTVYGPPLWPASASRSPLVRRILQSPYGPMYTLARRLAVGAGSAYDVAVRIQNYLEANYTYSEQSPARRYPLEAFLFSDRIGYCQQFSGAMALMLRMDGIPARVAVGFRSGSPDAAGITQVRAVDAHSWVEVYFTGTGWVSFDPTPPRTTDRPAQVALFTQNISQYEAIAATVAAAPQLARQQSPDASRRRLNRIGTDGPMVLIGLALVALVATLALTGWWLAGRVRLRRSLDGDGELAAAELVWALRALGFVLPTTPTLTQLERVVSVHGGPGAARYVRLLRDRRYAPSSHGTPTLRDRRRLRHALTAHLGLESRLRGQWALPPGTIRAHRKPAPTR